MKQHVSFTLTAALASAIINVTIVYLLGVVFLISDLSIMKLLLFCFAQFVAIIIVPRIFISAAFKDYIQQCKAKKIALISSRYFWILLGLFYAAFLVLLFQLTPVVTNYVVTENFGRYMDGLLNSGNTEGSIEESFSEQSFLVQNIFLCFLGIVIAIISSRQFYKKLVSSQALA